MNQIKTIFWVQKKGIENEKKSFWNVQIHEIAIGHLLYYLISIEKETNIHQISPEFCAKSDGNRVEQFIKLLWKLCQSM